MVQQDVEADENNGQAKEGCTCLLEGVPDRVVYVQGTHHDHKQDIGCQDLEGWDKNKLAQLCVGLYL